MIYTKIGDDGTTSLIGGKRVPKCCPRVEAYGTVDELNAHIGLLAEMVQSVAEPQYAILKQARRDLFVVQTLLAVEGEVGFTLPQLPTQAVEQMEGNIDALQSQLPQLRSFVIPGGSLPSAQCHVARTVCRRAERCIVLLASQAEVPETISCYINRLSDYLFVLSRWLLVSQGVEESLV